MLISKTQWRKQCLQACAVLVSLALSTAVAAATAADSNEQKTLLSTLTGHIALLQKNLSTEQSVQANLQQELRANEIKIGQSNQQIRSLNQQFTATELELQKIRRNQQMATAQLTKQQTALAEQQRLLYQLGQAPTFKTILNPQDRNTTQRHLAYYRYLTTAHLLLQADLKQTLTLLNASRTAIAEREKRLSILLIEKQQQQHQLDSARSRREAVITALNNQTRTKEQELISLAADQKALQNRLTTLQDESLAAAAAQSFDKLRGKLHWPLKGKISTAFGSREGHNKHSTGVVIDAPEGTPVRAISTGKVIFASWLRGFGLLVIVNHGDGYMSLYGRNQALYAKMGDTVQAGDILASIGNTGGYDKTGLYFEIRRNGSPIDPRPWCA